MIKLWIKHKLAEIALNNMLSRMIQNLTPTPQTYQKGDKFHLIRIASQRPSTEIRHSGLRNATIIANNHGILHITFESILYDYFIDGNGIHHDAPTLRGRIVRIVNVDDIVYAGNMI